MEPTGPPAPPTALQKGAKTVDPPLLFVILLLKKNTPEKGTQHKLCIENSQVIHVVPSRFASSIEQLASCRVAWRRAKRETRNVAVILIHVLRVCYVYCCWYMAAQIYICCVVKRANLFIFHRPHVLIVLQRNSQNRNIFFIE